jgi:hypothetical protein
VSHRKIILEVQVAASTDYPFESLKLLFDYTKFHIGIYASLAGAFVTLLGSKFAERWRIPRPGVIISLCGVVVAGASGGVVASSLPSLVGRNDYGAAVVGPSWCPVGMTVSMWTHIEHGAFWMAILSIVVSSFIAAYSQSKAGRAARAVEVRGEVTIKRQPPHTNVRDGANDRLLA